MIKQVFIWLSLISLSSFAYSSVVNLCHDCPQKTIVSAWYCNQCSRVLLDKDIKTETNVTYCNSCSTKETFVKVQKVKACERTYWKANCECEELSFTQKNCCEENGKKLEKVVDYALIVDKCSACQAWAMPGKEIQHNESKHNYLQCTKCGSISFEKTANCKCDAELKPMKIQPHITKNICNKSGIFPHNPEIPFKPKKTTKSATTKT